MTNLSPTAQAVLHSFWDAPVSPARNYQIAAALRAAADHVYHARYGSNCVDYLCEIAAELEGQS